MASEEAMKAYPRRLERDGGFAEAKRETQREAFDAGMKVGAVKALREAAEAIQSDPLYTDDDDGWINDGWVIDHLALIAEELDREAASDGK